jgi:geranylgeranyl diphosphate synthase type I
VIDASGAHQQVEDVIGELAARAATALQRADLDEQARAVLGQLATAATDRVV